MTTLTTFRAIGSAVAGRLVRIAGWTTAGILSFLIAAVVILANIQSSWWYVMLIPFILIGIVAFIFFFIAHATIKRMAPHHLTREQRQQLIVFSKRTITFARNHAVSLPVLGMSLAKSALISRSLDPLRELYSESSDLYKEYQRIAASLESAIPPQSGKA